MESFSNTNIPGNSAQQPFPNEQSDMEIKRVYNCDINLPQELLAPSTVQIEDKALLAFKQRLEEIVGRRDTLMTAKINSLLRENSSDKRYSVAVGDSK